ncbi:acyltransferase family protein [Helcococcus kunzii]|uniref:acyltransferase family protein n=1 Tax=Helcococcus kunzii TaxID=40091 RepID=UPI0024AE1371|nr:acyltransferase family protein [Helcococcus kunzii]
MRNRKLVGIDVLKTFAIIAVVLYHITNKYFPGGFIGVDLFFVISGYLLANSLVNKLKNEGDIKFFQNIKNRIRQLWPTLFIVIFTVVIFLVLFNKPVLDVSHRDALAGMTFTSNWWYIINKVSYFDSFTLSPFKHLWYLGVLLQSYIIITFLFKGFYRVKIFKKYNVFIVLMSMMAIGSFILQVKYYTPQDVSRVYYGTDTRIYEIIIGVLGYFLFPMEKLRTIKTSKMALFANVTSIVTLAMFIYFVRTVSEVYQWVYQFGFLLFAIMSLLMIISFGSVTNVFSKILNFIPFFSNLGKNSYGIYLWHFPIIVLTQLDVEIGNPNIKYTAIRLAVIFVLSYLTYEYIEKPISRKGLVNQIKDGGFTVLLKNTVFYAVSGLFIMGLFGIAVPFISTAFVDTSKSVVLDEEIKTNPNKKNIPPNNKESIKETEKEAPKESLKESDKETNKETTKETNKETNSEIVKEDTKDETEETKKEDTKSTTDNPSIKYNQLILIGDSIGVNIGNRILDMYPNSIVDAKISRQLVDSIPIFKEYSTYDSKETAVIIVLGTNGYFKEKNLDDIISLYPKSKKIIINIKAPVSWEAQVNEIFSNYEKNHKDVAVVDWYSVASKHPEYLASDQTHLMTIGIDHLMRLLEAELKK